MNEDRSARCAGDAETPLHSEEPLLIPGSAWVFVITFLSATSVGLLIQLFILPVVIPSLHAGHGLQAGGDWIGFHRDGVRLANALASDGWKAFVLRPDRNFPAGESGLLYYLTGIHEPWVVVPVSAAIFSICIVSIYNVFSEIAGRSVALLGLIPLLLFPGTIQFYAQAEKDVWAFTGSALLLVVLVGVARGCLLTWRRVLIAVVGAAMASFFCWLVRPYFVSVQFGVFVCGSVFVMGIGTKGLTFKSTRARAGCLLLCMLPIAFFMFDVPSIIWPSLLRNPSNLFDVQRDVDALPPAGCDVSPDSIDRILPSIVKRGLRPIVNIRLRQRAFGYNSGSQIDNDVCFARPSDIISYLPRALEISLLAPFPNMWFSSGVSIGAKAMRLLSGSEMLMAYLLLPGIVFLLWSTRAKPRALLILVIAFILPIILLLATTIPNIGTLYRMRYGYLQALVGLGVMGWIVFIKRGIVTDLNASSR